MSDDSRCMNEYTYEVVTSRGAVETIIATSINWTSDRVEFRLKGRLIAVILDWRSWRELEERKPEPPNDP